MKTILFFALVCVLVAASAFNVQAASSCNAVSTPKGKVTFANVEEFATFDSSLKQTGLAPGSYPFTFSLCDPSYAVTGGKACTPPSFVSQGSGTEAGCNVVFPTVQGIGYNDAIGKIQFNYTSTSNSLSWLTRINCACDATAKTLSFPSGQYVAGQTPAGVITLDFDATSPGCCPSAGGDDDSNGGSGGLTWGGVFLIIFFVPLGIYVIAAVAWNYKNEKRGKDLAPHPEFWGSLPGLAKDGITFLWAKIRGQPWSPSEAGSSSSQGAAGEAGGNYTPV